MTWETVIGLEVHVQLTTRSKMFCGCSTNFGDPPNTNVCPVCLALPGALPVPNAEAIRLATLASYALGCTVHARSVFARKNYFYPDLPKGYQISQFDRPLATAGHIEIESPTRGRVRIGITRLHVEEDSGKSIHDRVPGKTAIDLNRAGVPLAEIVSEPDLRSPAEARAYLTALKEILLAAGVSDCSMEEGSLSYIEKALEIERARQTAVLEAGGRVEQITQLYDSSSNTLRTMRSKEDSKDYRYFPDPDLPPLVLDATWLAARQSELPELPAAKRERFVARYTIPAYDAGVIVGTPALADHFEAVVVAGAEAKQAANWVMTEAMTVWNESGAIEVSASRLAALIALVQGGTVSHQSARKVYAELRRDAAEPKVVAERLGLVQVGDSDQLGAWVDQVVAANPGEVARYQGGEQKLIGFFTGQVMKQSGGKADPKRVGELLREKLK